MLFGERTYKNEQYSQKTIFFLSFLLCRMIMERQFSVFFNFMITTMIYCKLGFLGVYMGVGGGGLVEKRAHLTFEFLR